MLTQVGQTTGAVKTARLSQFLQEVFRADTDLHTLRVAALTLGRLVKAGGPVTAEVVDSEVPRTPSSHKHRMPVDTIMDTMIYESCPRSPYIRQRVLRSLRRLLRHTTAMQVVCGHPACHLAKMRPPAARTWRALPLSRNKRRLASPRAASGCAQVRRAILWLRDERADHLRYAGSLVLRQVRQSMCQTQVLLAHAIPARRDEEQQLIV